MWALGSPEKPYGSGTRSLLNEKRADSLMMGPAALRGMAGRDPTSSSCANASP